MAGCRGFRIFGQNWMINSCDKRVITIKQLIVEMTLKPLDNNWIKTSSLSSLDPPQQNLVLKVLSNLRSGIDLFNKASIAGQYRRPSQQKASSHKLPQLTKRNPTQLSSTITSVSEIDLNSPMQAFQSYGRICSGKSENPELALKNRLKTSQAKRTFGVARYNWKREKWGGVEMKGVVFRKKKPIVVDQ